MSSDQMKVSFGEYIEPNPEDKKKHWFDIVREVFSDASDDECDWLLWEQTGFPSFWNIPRQGNTPADCARTQLREFKAKSGPSND